jgi:pimeloyl-ACP methyl ester carboxylesterase
MTKVASKDGTQIDYDKKGQGPAVILVDGAMGYRALGFGNQLADLLSKRFTVYTYDRRGRGESGNTMPYALGREAEDIGALIDAAGGSAFVYGISSGACLALEAATRLGSKVKKLALYEPPYDSDPAAVQPWKEYRQKLSDLLRADRRGDAVTLFMHFVGTPKEMIDGMRQSPAWTAMESVAPTLMYDADDIGDDRSVPVKTVAGISVPTLVMDGGANLQIMPFMSKTADALAAAMPNAQRRTLDGQTHAVNAEALAPVLVEFFGG